MHERGFDRFLNMALQEAHMSWIFKDCWYLDAIWRIDSLKLVTSNLRAFARTSILSQMMLLVNQIAALDMSGILEPP